MSSGLCLLQRKELKFECSTKKALKLQQVLIEKGFKPEIFVDSTTQRLANLAFLNANDSSTDYIRPRVRVYYQDNLSLNDVIWLEVRNKKAGVVFKSRQVFDELRLLGIKGSLVSSGFVPTMIVDYERQAFNNFDLKIRITFDSDITYYACPEKFSRFKFGKFLGKDKPVMIKIKYVKVLPDSVLKIFKGLRKGKSKIAFGKKLLKEIKKGTK